MKRTNYIARAMFVAWAIIAFGIAGAWDMEDQQQCERSACVEVRYGN